MMMGHSDIQQTHKYAKLWCYIYEDLNGILLKLILKNIKSGISVGKSFRII